MPSAPAIGTFNSTDTSGSVSVGGSLGMRQALAGAGPVGEAGGVSSPSLIPREVKVEKPSTFSGRHADLSNFLFEML